MQLLTLFTLFLATVNAGHNLLHHRAPATRTESAHAVQKRQLTREKLILRNEKLTMASLFGRVDCSLPEPSTLACTCGPEYELCGPLCRDTTEDPDFCGDCATSCPPGPVGDRGCCAGLCTDFSADTDNCGVCGTQCDVINNEDCCSGACADLSNNPEHCGTCGTTCAGGETCCDSSCATPMDFFFDNNNCGSCGSVCPAGLDCCSGDCQDLNSDLFNCGVCGRYCITFVGPGSVCSNGECVFP